MPSEPPAAQNSNAPFIMRLPLWAFRWLHRSGLSRKTLRGGFLHGRLGDRLLDRSLWLPKRTSLARAWLIGLPITTVPFLPFQSILAGILGFLARANLLLCIGLRDQVRIIEHRPLSKRKRWKVEETLVKATIA